MTLIHVNGDLIKSDCTTIAHQANCMSTMGSGIAKTIAEIYPKAKKVDKESIMSKEERFGKFTHAVNPNGVTVVNLYGQFAYGRNGVFTKYDKVESALDSFFENAISGKLKDVNIEKFGVPFKMGCDRAGGDWSKVEEILEKMSSKYNVDIYIYKL